jgi:hypothetical protein
MYLRRLKILKFINKFLDSNTVHTIHSLLVNIIIIIIMNRQSVGSTSSVPLDLKDATGVSIFVLVSPITMSEG